MMGFLNNPILREAFLKQQAGSSLNSLSILPGEEAGVPQVMGASKPTGMQGFNQRLSEAMGSPIFQLGANLLAQSGPSTTPQGFGSILGRAGLNTMQQQQKQDMNALQKKLIEARLNKPEASSDFGRLNPSDFTPESLSKFQESRDYGDLVFRDKAGSDPSAVREFEYVSSLSPEEQELYFRTKRADSFASIPGAGYGRNNPVTGEFDPVVPEQTIVEGTESRSRAQGQGQAEGKAEADRLAKSPVIDSFNVAADELDSLIQKSPQGPLQGRLARTVFNKRVQAFDAIKQQMSADLRAVFRIPGEGQLSDREQALYDLQLPDPSNDKEVNEQIMRTLRQRISARIGEGETSSVEDLLQKYR